jgi:hypothetical protein
MQIVKAKSDEDEKVELVNDKDAHAVRLAG